MVIEEYIKLFSSLKESREFDLFKWKTYDDGNHLVVHNLGAGPQSEDMLSLWAPIEAYRLDSTDIKRMQLNSDYVHDFKTDPYFKN